MTSPPEQSNGTKERVWVDIEQRVFWRIDITDWLDPGEVAEECDRERIARGVLDYHECQIGTEVECTGWGWTS
ncbi:MAG TPA: hypothetical protein VG275_07225 [Solirubrobacteraceae bacterium]|jgi:hypothetical protein|nr:hypothetical protein [Solirubrobacteraceae bacterium]